MAKISWTSWLRFGVSLERQFRYTVFSIDASWKFADNARSQLSHATFHFKSRRVNNRLSTKYDVGSSKRKPVPPLSMKNKRKKRSASVVFLKVSCAPSATHLRVCRQISSLMRGHWFANDKSMTFYPSASLQKTNLARPYLRTRELCCFSLGTQELRMRSLF